MGRTEQSGVLAGQPKLYAKWMIITTGILIAVCFGGMIATGRGAAVGGFVLLLIMLAGWIGVAISAYFALDALFRGKFVQLIFLWTLGFGLAVANLYVVMPLLKVAEAHTH